MNLPFFKNLYLGQELSEDEFKDIPNPRIELHFHVMYKNLQVSFNNFDIWHRKFECDTLCLLGGMYTRRPNRSNTRISTSQEPCRINTGCSKSA